MTACCDEINPFVAARLREPIKLGGTAPGDVDERGFTAEEAYAAILQREKEVLG